LRLTEVDPYLAIDAKRAVTLCSGKVDLRTSRPKRSPPGASPEWLVFSSTGVAHDCEKQLQAALPHVSVRARPR